MEKREFLKMLSMSVPAGVLANIALPKLVNAAGPMIPNTDIQNVKDFGAVGDRVTDDTAAFQAAINAGGLIYVPYTTTGYVVQNLSINSNIIIFGENKPTLKANNTLFNIYGSNNPDILKQGIDISNFVIDMGGAPSGTSAFLFKTRSVTHNINMIRLSKISVENAYCSILDENSHAINPNSYIQIINLHVSDFISRNNKGTQHNLNDAWAFILYESVTVDNTVNGTGMSAPSFFFQNFAGLVLRDVDTGGGPNDAIGAHGIACQNGSALFLERVYGDTCGGYGITINNVIQVNAQDITAAQCKQGQILISNCQGIQAQNVYIQGRYIKDGNTYPNAIGLYVAATFDAQFTNVYSVDNTGDGVNLQNSYRCLFTNCRTNSNQNIGFNENGTSSQYNIINSLISPFNSSYSLVLASSTSNCVNWLPNSGVFYIRTQGGQGPNGTPTKI